jgi:hypothetical protein
MTSTVQHPSESSQENEDMNSVTHGAKGPAPSTKDNILETGAAATQSFEPLKAICAHLNAFHVYANDTKRVVEANHYCTHLSADVCSNFLSYITLLLRCRF